MALRIACFGLLFFASLSSLTAQPRERDTWHVYLADAKQAYGNVHTIVSRTKNDQWRYSITTRLLFDFLGVQRQEVRRTTNIVVTSSYELISVESKCNELSGETTVQGVVKDGVLSLQIVRAGVSQKRQIKLTDGMIPSECLNDWLADRDADFEQGNLVLIHEDEWLDQKATIRQLSNSGKDSKWKVDFGTVNGVAVIEIGSDQIIDQITYSQGNRMRRSSAKQAGQIKHTKISGRSVLMFPVKKDIGSPNQIQEMTIKLSWKKLPLEDFNLTDNRQKIVEWSEKNGEYRALVRIGVDERTPTNVKFPISDEKFDKTLSSTRYIKPNNEKIRQTAAKIVAGKSTAYQAVQAIADWVFNNVEATLIVETLSGPEVLESGKGKCSEYSTLFASLARSAGIPTRIVLGERLAGGHWIGHMWNEVYVGRWITVDASANEVGNTCALLKLVHSETLEGTQPLRFALTKSLDLSIQDFQLKNGKQPASTITGVKGTSYMNAKYACKIAAPAKNWKLDDKSTPGVVTVQFHFKDKKDLQIHFVAFAVPASVSAKTLIDNRLKIFESKFKDRGFELVNNKPCQVDGAKGQTITYQWQYPGEPKRIASATEYMWIQGDFGYLFNIHAPQKNHDEMLPQFEAILKSFEHLKPR